MERDKQLREILLNSAEKASADFTATVMNKVNNLSAMPVYYQPLVSARLKRLFLYAFGALTGAILSLCLIIALTNLSVGNWMRNVEVPVLNYNTILLFILTFWTVFTFNSFLEKKFFSRKVSSFHTH